MMQQIVDSKNYFNCGEENLKNVRNWIYQDPAKVIRYLILFGCGIGVIVQLMECADKLSRPSVATHSQFYLNETISLPAITVCREPPYKPDVLDKYNLPSHPKFARCWKDFPFGEVVIDDVFNEATYNESDIIAQYGLNGTQNNIELSSSLHLNLGKCFTFKSRKPFKSTFKKYGYSIMLKHDKRKNESENSILLPPGWHVFVHDPKDNFTELKMSDTGGAEYIYAEVEEEIEIKLQAQHFAIIADVEINCSNNPAYSAPKCNEICIWEQITNEVSCSAPWMPDIMLETCSNYSSIYNLITDYYLIYDEEKEPNCNCKDACRSTMYSTYIQNRKYFPQQYPRTQLWIYYTSKVINIVEERPGYDFSQFIADIGGSLGFLLGLSVLEIIEFLEKIAFFIFGKRIDKLKLKSKNSSKSDNKSEKTPHVQDDVVHDGSSDVTMEIAATEML